MKKIFALLFCFLVLGVGFLFSENSKVHLKAKIQLGTQVEDRLPIGVSNKFTSETEIVYGWTLIKGARQPTSIEHVWLKAGVVQTKVSLDIKSPEWRTWSRMEIKGQLGKWVFEVRDQDGNLIKSKEFVVK